ncbi:right-handed parallel beta-helix repeat-containing protein [Candidatus Fermentibacterales bacterium]|nr:right-handed parallel beta-helix repeat-containing protein [Candidatus Fermentibacterales bacterium]
MPLSRFYLPRPSAGLLLALWIASGVSESATYYVSPDGNDAWSGTSPDSAFASFQHAADIVLADDSVIGLDGDYAGFDLRTSGTQSAPIVFHCPGGSVWIDAENPVTPDGINIEGADWVTVSGFNVTGIDRNGIRAALGGHITITGCYCEHCYERGIFTAFVDHAVIEENECCYSTDEHGIYHSNSGDYPSIRFNRCHHNNACGIHMNGDLSAGGDGTISFATVEGNTVWENGAGGGGSGINCDCVVESDFFNNLLYGNHASGISLYRIDGASGSTGNRVFNNTVVQPSDGRWCININTGSTDNRLLNNILLNAHSWRGSIAIDASSHAGFQSDYNAVQDRLSADGGDTVIPLADWQQLGWDLCSMLADDWGDIFVDWQSGDFHLEQSSQAVDGGSAEAASLVLYDLDWVPRPQMITWDIGCYELCPEGLEPPGAQQPGGGPAWQASPGCVVFTGLGPGCRVDVLDLTGRLVASLGPALSGSLAWNGSGKPVGIYLVRVSSHSGETLAAGTALMLRSRAGR